MKLKVTEKCLINLEPMEYALRTYQYEAEGDTLTEALYNFKHNYDSDNIISNSIDDEFEGECLDSEEISIEPVDSNPMMVLIRKDALQIMSREIPAHVGYTSYQFKFREMIGKLEGTWVEVETDYLFNNQFNTVPLKDISESGLRIMENIVQAIVNDKRVDKVRCRYCGKMSSVDDKICPHCEKSEYLYRTDINREMPLVIRYRNCDSDVNTINCTKWDEFISIIDSNELLKEGELLEVRRYGHKIYKEVKTIGELYKIRKEEV